MRGVRQLADGVVYLTLFTSLIFLCIFGQNSEHEYQTAYRENENIPQI
jgi:hypothetical protein